jgi:hypothetical protein
MHRREWGLAYLEQARSDFKIYKLLNDSQVEICHALHFLQMATEKLSKASLIMSGSVQSEDVQTTHCVFVQMLRAYRKNSSVAQVLDFKGPDTTEAFERHIKSLLPIARWIETLAPALSLNINAEYPWRNATNLPTPPAQYTFPEWFQFGPRKQSQLLALVEQLLEQAENIFG